MRTWMVGDGIECGDESGEEAPSACSVDLGDEGESICLCESVADTYSKEVKMVAAEGALLPCRRAPVANH